LGEIQGRPANQKDGWQQAQSVRDFFCFISFSILILILRSLTGITKLSDANNAGTRQASQCTLILTEGDSAKALAVAGLGVVGRDNFGVFPLRGKLLNVREAKHDQIMKNEEIQNIKKIMGLQHNKDYSDVGNLRYGQLMIMTDQVSYCVSNKQKLPTQRARRITTARISRDLSSTSWTTSSHHC
jgi:hypothetical protein